MEDSQVLAGRRVKARQRMQVCAPPERTGVRGFGLRQCAHLGLQTRFLTARLVTLWRR